MLSTREAALEAARQRLERFLDEEYPYAGCRDDLRLIYDAAKSAHSRRRK